MNPNSTNSRFKSSVSRYLAFIIILIPIFNFAQTNYDTIYIDKKWEECSKKKHKYIEIYKETSYIVNNKSLISFEVYDDKNVIQVTGYITDSIGSKQWVGLHSFYSKSGKIEAYALYDYHSTIEFFPEMKKYSTFLEECDTTYKTLYVSFLKNGHKRKLGFYSKDLKRICHWIRYNQFKNDIYYTTDYTDTTVRTKTYRPNGAIWKEESYLNGEKHGGWTKYSRIGCLQKLESFSDGKKHGPWRTYSKYDCHLKVEKIYDHGKLIKKTRNPFSK